MSNFDADCRYTLADLETARAAYQAIEDRWADYSGNNPNKFHSQRRDASARLREVESELKRAGLLPYTPEELRTKELDRLFPDAESRSVVGYAGAIFLDPLQAERAVQGGQCHGRVFPQLARANQRSGRRRTREACAQEKMSKGMTWPVPSARTKIFSNP